MDRTTVTAVKTVGKNNRKTHDNNQASMTRDISLRNISQPWSTAASPRTIPKIPHENQKLTDCLLQTTSSRKVRGNEGLDGVVDVGVAMLCTVHRAMRGLVKSLPVGTRVPK
jgi:hypothetical protein